MGELIQVPPPAGPRASRPLQALFAAQMCLESWERRRRWVGRLIIGLSLPMAYFMWNAVGVAAPGARLVLLLWAFAFVGWCWTNAWVMVWRRSLDGLLASVGGRYVRVEAEGGPDAGA